MTKQLTDGSHTVPFPSDGLQEEWQREGHHNISQPLTPPSTQETEWGCITTRGAMENRRELPFLTGRRQGVTFTRRCFAHMQHNPRSHRALDLQHKHKPTIQCRMRWHDHQVTERSSVVVYRIPPKKSSVPCQKALVLPQVSYSTAWCFRLCSRQ